MRQAVLWLGIATVFIGCSCSRLDANSQDPKHTQHTITASGVPDPADSHTAATDPALPDRSSPGSSSLATARKQPQATLPSENLVIQGNAVSADSAGRLIRSEKFDAFVSTLAAESYANPLAQEVTAVEKEWLESFFGKKESLRNFACGTSICAGTIALGTDRSLYKKFSDDFLENGRHMGTCWITRLNWTTGISSSAW
jgi:hypothetical protein